MHRSASPTCTSPTAATVPNAPSSPPSSATTRPPSAHLKLERASLDSSNHSESLVNPSLVSSQTLSHEQAATGSIQVPVHEADLDPPVHRTSSSGLRLCLLIQMPSPSIPRDHTVHSTSSGSSSDQGGYRVPTNGSREIALGIVEIPEVLDRRSPIRPNPPTSQPHFQPVTATIMPTSAAASTPVTMQTTPSGS
jgi:hypothetical protein